MKQAGKLSRTLIQMFLAKDSLRLPQIGLRLHRERSASNGRGSNGVDSPEGLPLYLPLPAKL